MLEIRNFGWNSLTYCFIVTTTFTIIGTIFLVCQIKDIWKKKTSKAVSFVWYTSRSLIFLSYLFYGIQGNSLALIIQSSFRFPLTLIVLLGIWKFKKIKTVDKILSLVLFIIFTTLYFIPNKVFVLSVFAIIGIISALSQPLEIWRLKSCGVVNVNVIHVYNMSVIFWTIYGLIVNDWPLVVISFLNSVVYTITILLWYKYKKRRF